MQYLNQSDLGGAYNDATQNARRNWLKYDEIERLMNNEVRSDLPANMPKVNDGSLQAAVKKIPKRLFAKPMTGTIQAVDRDEDWLAELVNIILTKRIIPNATTDASFLRKWKLAVRNSKAYGSQPIYTFFTQHGTYTGADMSLPYVRNVYLEPGKVSDLASDFIFMDSFYTKLQMKRLVDKAKQDVLEAEELGEEYEGMWDAAALQQVLDAGPQGKESWNQPKSEREGTNRNEKGLYKLVTCFNRGYEAPFYTFAPNLSDKVVGTQYNTNPSGDLPIIYLYDDEDLINPYGKGLVEVAGPNQNVLDNLTQTDVLQTQIGSQPPITIGGDRSQTNLKSFQYSPRAFWFTGNAQVDVVKAVDANIYGQLPSRFGLYKSQQQFITGTFDNSVSAESGAPGFSKTDAGVNALQGQTNADDNDTLQSVADAYTRVIKSMINIHMNNMEGTEMLSLEGDEIDRMAKTEIGIPMDENGQPATSEIELIWDNLRGNFDFNVDPSSSMLEDSKNDVKALQEAIAAAISDPNALAAMQASGYKFDAGEAYAEMFTKMGLKNIDKILVKISPEEMAEMEQQQAMGQIDPTTGMPMEQAVGEPGETNMNEDMQEQPAMEQQMLPDEQMMPEEPMMQEQQMPEGPDLQTIMEQYNVDEEDAASIAVGLSEGLNEEQAVQLAEYLRDEVVA